MEEGVGGVRPLQVGIGLVDGVALPVVGEVEGVLAQALARCGDQVAAPARVRRVAAIFVDVVAVMIDEGELLAREVAVGGVIAVLVILAAGDAELQGFRRGGGEGKGAGPAVDAFLAARLESVPVGPVGLEAGQLDMDAVAELGPGQLFALADDRREPSVRGDLPFDRHRGHRHAAVQVERIGRQPRPDDESVGGGLAGGDAEAERISAPDRLCAHDGRRGEGGGSGTGDEGAAGNHGPDLAPDDMVPIRVASYTATGMRGRI